VQLTQVGVFNHLCFDLQVDDIVGFSRSVGLLQRLLLYEVASGIEFIVDEYETISLAWDLAIFCPRNRSLVVRLI